MDISIMIDMAEKPTRSVVDEQGGDNRAQSVCKKGILIWHYVKTQESDTSIDNKEIILY